MDKQDLENQESQGEQLEIENFKQAVAYPIQKLQSIVYNDYLYLSTIANYIQRGLKKIKHDELQYSLAYFAQAEKILEYGASCGKIINRTLIFCVLHNEAFCYQKLSELPQAVKYTEAIIFNLKTYLKEIEASPSCSNIIESDFTKNSALQEKKKLALAQYELQYCSMNSQLKVRKVALESAKNAVKILQQFFLQIRQSNFQERFNIKAGPQKQVVVEIFSSFQPFKEEFQLSKVDEYIKLAKFYLNGWVVKKRQNTKLGINKILKTYSINQFVELEPMEYSQNDLINEEDGTAFEIMKQVIHCSMGYFQISTQYRLIAEQKYNSDQNYKFSSEEFRLSNIYHLLSIIFLAINLPYDIIFMEQILSSYHYHFHQNLKQPMTVHSKPQTTILFKKLTRKKTIFSKKRKLSELQSDKKKKVVIEAGSSSKKKPHKQKKSLEQSPRTVKQEYFLQGKVEKIAIRTQRLKSNESKRSFNYEKMSAKKSKNKLGRQRLKTQTNKNDKVFNRKQVINDYCILPRKKQVKVTEKNSKREKYASEENMKTLRKKTSEKCFKLKEIGKNKIDKKQKKKLKKSTQFLEVDKKKKSIIIKNYYI